ncbi:hypothetical protein FI667_g8060, partial [Globisporangium splendens]
MRFTLPEGTFPPLNLTQDDEHAITDLADRIVAETLQVNEEFIAGNRKLPKQEWKLIKSKEQVHVYRQRKQKDGENNYSDSSGSASASGQSSENPKSRIYAQHSLSSSSSSQRTSDSIFSDGIVDDAKPEHIPFTIAHGLVPGTIDDVSFGMFGNTEYTWRLRHSYNSENAFDSYKILATIHSPTRDDPFRFLGIKWLSRPFNAFISRRDFVYIEATGMALDSNGERVSYHLMHSFELKQIPELHNLDIVRGNVSTCYIARQRDVSTTEVYCRAFIDLRGELMQSVSASVHTDFLLGVASVVDCSYVKKLTWQMQRSRRSNSQIEKHAPVKTCEVCSKSLNKLGMFASGSSCQICRKMLCGKCAVERKITVDISVEVTQKDFSFCVPCVIEAKKLSAWDIAVSNLPPGTE